MAEDKTTKAKRIIARFSWKEFNEFERWMRKKRDKLWEAEQLKRKQEHCDSIKALPVGTQVVFTDSRHPDLCGKVGKIERHLERSSSRTNVDFGVGIGIWRIPRSNLSANVSDENIKQLKTCKYLSGVLNKALGRIG